MQKNWLHKFYFVLSILAMGSILLTWVMVSAYRPRLMPPPEAVWTRFMGTFDRPIRGVSLFGHAWNSLKRVFTGLIFAWSLGISFGTLIGWNKKCKAIFGTVFELLRPIPAIAWIPLVIMWFGIGELPKVILVFLGTFPTMVINSSSGVKLADKQNIDVGRAFGASRLQMLFEIVIPTALPSIFAGVRSSVGGGWLVVLAAEMLGANSGLGFLVTRGWEGGDIPLVVVAIIFIGVIGAVLSYITASIERRLCPWNVKRSD